MAGLIPYAGMETKAERMMYSDGPEKTDGTLTARQVEILELHRKGMSIKQIAESLGLATSTAGKHLQKARQNVALAKAMKKSVDD